MMIQGALYEESAAPLNSRAEAKFYTVFKVAAIVFFAGAALIASFLPIILDGFLNGENALAGAQLAFAIIEYALFIVLPFCGGLTFWLLKNRFNVSYDYIFVEDELRITKVYNGRKRKFLCTLKTDQMLKIGWVERDSYLDTLRGLGGSKPRRMTSNKQPAEEKEFYYILYSSSMGKTLYIIECRQMMLEYVVRAAGVNKLERK